MKAKILVVDDDEALCQILKAVLEETGHKVETCGNIREGLKQIRKEQPDLIFLDVKMPGGNGIQFLKKIRKINAQVPVYVLTGYADLQSAQEALKYGATEYITKPVDLKKIQRIVKDALVPA